MRSADEMRSQVTNMITSDMESRAFNPVQQPDIPFRDRCLPLSAGRAASENFTHPCHSPHTHGGACRPADSPMLLSYRSSYRTVNSRNTADAVSFSIFPQLVCIYTVHGRRWMATRGEESMPLVNIQSPHQVGPHGVPVFRCLHGKETRLNSRCSLELLGH